MKTRAGIIDSCEEDETTKTDNTRDDIIRMIFNLPITTRFYTDYSCSIRGTVAMHGRLYPSDDYVCFYSNLFGQERKIILPYEDIQTIRKVTVMIIQPAISIATEKKKYQFLSFWGSNADECLELLQRLHQRKHARSLENDAFEPTTSPLQEKNDSEQDKHDMRPRRTSRVLDVDEVRGDMQPMEMILDTSFSFSGSSFLKQFVLDHALFGLAVFFSRTGATEVECGLWEHVADASHNENSRTIQFRIPIDAPIGPKSSRVHMLQHLKTLDNGSTVIESSTRLVDIPYGDYFSVEDRWTVIPGDAEMCRLTIEFTIVFTKSTLWKGKISTRARTDNIQKFENWVQLAKESMKLSLPSPASSKAKKALKQNLPVAKASSRTKYLSLPWVLCAILFVIQCCLVFRLYSNAIEIQIQQSDYEKLRVELHEVRLACGDRASICPIKTIPINIT